MDCSPPGSSVHGICQTKILEWVAIFFSRGSSLPRDQTQVSCIAGRFFSHLSHQGIPKKKHSLAQIQTALKEIQIIKEHHQKELKNFKVCQNHHNGQGLGGGEMKPHVAITLHIKIIRPKQLIKDRQQRSFRTKFSKRSRKI